MSRARETSLSSSCKYPSILPLGVFLVFPTDRSSVLLCLRVDGHIYAVCFVIVFYIISPSRGASGWRGAVGWGVWGGGEVLCFIMVAFQWCLHVFLENVLLSL